MTHSPRLAIPALLALLLFAAGCAPPLAAGVRIIDPFARPNPSVGGNGGAFMTIVNLGGEPDHLLFASSPAAATVELHETVMDGDVMRMVPHPEGFPVDRGGRLELKPGGKHVMLIGLAEPLLPGNEVEITLNFERAGSVVVKAPVRQ